MRVTSTHALALLMHQKVESLLKHRLTQAVRNLRKDWLRQCDTLEQFYGIKGHILASRTWYVSQRHIKLRMTAPSSHACNI